mgnify:FL=1
MSEKKSLPIWIGCVTGWFATHCGSGFATGVQAAEYFTKFGAIGLVTPFLSMGILGVMAYIAVEFCRRSNTHNYKEFAYKFYAPFGSIFGIIWDLISVIGTALITGAVLAGGGELLSEVFGVPYLIALAIIAGIILICTSLGVEFFRNISTLLTIPIVICLTCISVYGIAKGWGNLSKVVGNWEIQGSIGGAILDSLKYAGVQCTFIGVLAASSLGIASKRDSIKISVGGALMNALMLGLVSILLLAYFPGSSHENLPILSILKNAEVPFLSIMYQITLFCAMISTGVGLIFSIVTRLEGVRMGKSMKRFSHRQRRILWAFMFLLIAYGISVLGLRNIVGGGYRFLAALKIPVVMIPVLVLGPWRLRQTRTGTEKN